MAQDMPDLGIGSVSTWKECIVCSYKGECSINVD